MSPPPDDRLYGAGRLPRAIETDPDVVTIRAALARAPRRLWSGGTVEVSVVPFAAALQTVLHGVAARRHLVRGLEAAASALAAERAGLAALPPAAAAQGARVSRLLLVTDDGAERFYRQVERLVLEHDPRVLAVVVEAGGAALGRHLYGGDATVKLVLTGHKTATVAVLRALAAP